MPNMPEIPAFTPPGTPPVAPPDAVIAPKKGPMLAAIIVVVLLVAAAGVAAYTFFGASPTKVLERSTKAMAQLKSVAYKGKITFEPEGMTPEPGNPLDPSKLKRLVVTISGSSELGEGKTKSAGTFDASLEGLLSGSAGFEFRDVENKVYGRFTAVPTGLPIDLTGIVDKWISFTKTEVTPTKPENAANNSASAEKEKQIRELVKKTQFFTVAKKLPDDSVDNVKTYHYKVALDKKNLKQFITESNQITDGKSLTADELKKLDDELAPIVSEQADLWIGKNDYLIRRVFYATSTQGVVPLPTLAGTPGVKGKLSIDATLSAFNQPVTVIVPENARPFEEIISEIFGQILGAQPGAVIPPVEPNGS